MGLLSFTVGVLGFVVATVFAVQSGGTFELGDEQVPVVAGSADLQSDPSLPGPDWEDLFAADRTLRDDFPAPGGNGIPDYVDLYGGQWAVIMEDDVSLGVGLDTTVLVGSDGLVYRGSAAAAHDLANAYAYSTFDSGGDLLLYAGAERLDSGDSYIEFEFNQAHIRLGYGPPWEITGGRTTGDLLARLVFRGGGLDSVEIERWVETSPGQFNFQSVDGLSGESCNADQTICAVCNGTDVDGGPWPNFDTVGDPEIISTDRFVEIGINVGALVGLQPDYVSIQVRTPEDITFGYFAEGN
jgi:hypothetical protein